jgi:DNA-binding NarL/FixJ family response regulator
MIRIMLVEDHPGMRAAIRQLLESSGGMEIVGEVDDGADAIAAVDGCKPDVVVMDLAMPRVNGIKATSTIKSLHAEISIVVLSKYCDKMIVAGALEAGATGYVVKHRAAEDLVTAIQSARAGRRFVSI